LVYSVENSFQVVNLGRKNPGRLIPAKKVARRFCECSSGGQILLGWALATFFVAGVTGIARKD